MFKGGGLVWKYGTPIFNFILYSSLTFLSLSLVRERLELRFVKEQSKTRLTFMEEEKAEKLRKLKNLDVSGRVTATN